jgi:metal transporter CNNM
MSNSTLCPELQEAAAISIPVPLNYFIIMFLISLSALFSGLTLGLLGLDKMGLQIVIGGDDLVAAKYAKAILPVRENGNQLLCTLLLGNVSVNSMLSILMADMTSGVVGFLSSTIMIVIFGEIIPQASCSRHALKVGYYSLPVVKFFILVFYFAAYPLGYLLDKLLGDDIGTIHSRTELRKMLELHVKHGAVDVDSGGVMDGALRYRDMMVKEVVCNIM